MRFDINSNISLGELLMINNGLSTCLIYGGEIRISDSDPTMINITKGAALFRTSNKCLKPEYRIVEWSDKNCLYPKYIDRSDNDFTTFSVDVSGNIIESNIAPDSKLYPDQVYLGCVVHVNGICVGTDNTIRVNGFNFGQSISDISDTIGYINHKKGNKYYCSGKGLRLSKTSGKILRIGADCKGDTKSNYININADNELMFVRTWRKDFSGDVTSIPGQRDIDTCHYDNGLGSSECGNFPDGEIRKGEFQVLRVYLFPTEINRRRGLTSVQYGQRKYRSMDEALYKIHLDEFQECPQSDESLLRGYIVIEGECTDLSDARFIEANKFGGL